MKEKIIEILKSKRKAGLYMQGTEYSHWINENKFDEIAEEIIKSDNRIAFPLCVVNTKDGNIHQVWKYIIDEKGRQHVYCNSWRGEDNDWSGHHIIGDNCEFVKYLEFKKIEL